jgi:PST family polysaccharide transporter
MLKVLLTIGILQGVAMAVLVVRTKALAVVLGPEGVGVLAVIDKLLAVLAQTVSLSLPYAAIRFLPGLWVQAPGACVALLRRMALILLVLASAATLFGIGVTLAYPGAWGSDLLPYRSVLLLAFLALPVVAIVPFLENAIAARLQPNGCMFFGVLHALVFTLAGLAGAWYGGLGGIYGLYAVLGLVLVLPVLRVVGRTPEQQVVVPSPVAEERTCCGLPRAIWKFSLTLFGLAFLMPYAALALHYAVLSSLGAEIAGWMQAAIGISLVVRVLLGKAQAVFFTPQVNRGGSPRQRMQWVDEYLVTFSALCAAVVLPLVLFPEVAVVLLYSEKFSPAAAFVALFVLSEVLMLFAGSYQGLVVALDHLGYHVAQNLVAQGLLLVVARPVVERYGLAGVGVALIGVPCLLYAGSTLFLGWKYGLSPSRRCRLLTLFVFVSLGSGGVVSAFLTEPSVSTLAIKLLVYGSCIGGLGLFLGPVERERLLALARGGWTRLGRGGTKGPVQGRAAAQPPAVASL